MRIHLVRHGQTPSNLLGAIDTAPPGAGLTDLGLRQAEAAGKVLAKLGVESVHASTLTRTQLTAEPLAGRLSGEVQVWDGFREIDAARLEMRTDADSLREYGLGVYEWMLGRLDHRVADGITGVEFLARFDAAITDVVAQGAERAAIFSHGAAIRAWVALRATGSPTGYVGLPNTAAVTIEGDPGVGWRVVEFGQLPLGGEELLGQSGYRQV